MEEKKVEFSSLLGLVINKIEFSLKDDDSIKLGETKHTRYDGSQYSVGISSNLVFHTNDGIYYFDPEGDCCAHIYLEDIIGDVKDLLDTPVLQAEKIESDQVSKEEYDKIVDGQWDVSVWCFYKLVTINGYVTFRILDHNNGYYSTSLDFKKLPMDKF